MNRPLVVCAFAFVIIILVPRALLAESPSKPETAVSPDTVLIESANVKVTRRDFDLEVASMPPEVRGAVINSQRRMSEVLGRLLVMKTLAREARAQGVERDPEVQAKLAHETERLYAQVRQSKLDDEAGADFDAKRAQWEARAREIYASERSQFTAPEEVSVSHILFTTQQHTSDEAKKLAEDARARIAAGADFNQLARTVSEDLVAKQHDGSIGYVTRAQVDPVFAAAAFALKNVGDVSEPVHSSFGWHIIRLDGRKPARQLPFDDVRDEIVAQLRQKFVSDRRDAMLSAIGNDPTVKANTQALESMYVRPLSTKEALELRARSSPPATAAPKQQ